MNLGTGEDLSQKKESKREVLNHKEEILTKDLPKEAKAANKLDLRVLKVERKEDQKVEDLKVQFLLRVVPRAKERKELNQEQKVQYLLREAKVVRQELRKVDPRVLRVKDLNLQFQLKEVRVVRERLVRLQQEKEERK